MGRPESWLCHPKGVTPGGLDSWIPKGPSSSLFPRAVEGSEFVAA